MRFVKALLASGDERKKIIASLRSSIDNSELSVSSVIPKAILSGCRLLSLNPQRRKVGQAQLKHAFSLLKKKILKELKPAVLSDEEKVEAYYICVGHTVNWDSNTGIQRVTRMLCKELSDICQNVYFVKWDRYFNELVFISVADLKKLSMWNGIKVTDSIKNRYLKCSGYKIPEHDQSCRAWLICPEIPWNYDMGLGKENATDVLIAKAKASGLNTGFIFYDLIPLKRPELAASHAPLHATYAAQICQADAIFPISDFVTDELEQYFVQNSLPYSECALLSLPLPCESVLAPRATCSSFCNSSDEKIVFCVGTVSVHKNQLALIEAFDLYTKEHPNANWKLVVAGIIADDQFIVSGLKKYADNARIQIIGPISDDELLAWYNKSAFTVFPSIEEGFGLPIAESIWFGKPCICANFGAMAELSNLPGCIAVDTHDILAIKLALESLCDDVSKLIELSKAACEADLSTWRDYTKELVANLPVK